MKSKEEEKISALFLMTVGGILIIAEIIAVSFYFTLPEFIIFTKHVFSGIFFNILYFSFCVC
jgi:hypothetical protein